MLTLNIIVPAVIFGRVPKTYRLGLLLIGWVKWESKILSRNSAGLATRLVGSGLDGAEGS
jgi:hypothetical protein